MDEKKHVLKIRGLNVSFKTSAGVVNAVRGVDLDLFEGETLAIVGESGSGKSVTVKTVMGIRASNETVNAGSVEFTYRNGEKEVTEDLVKLSAKEKMCIRDSIKEWVKKIHSYGPKLVTATMGELGSICYDGTTLHEFGIVPTRVVNTVGAGDSYIAGFTYGILNGWSAVSYTHLDVYKRQILCTARAMAPSAIRWPCSIPARRMKTES